MYKRNQDSGVYGQVLHKQSGKPLSAEVKGAAIGNPDLNRSTNAAAPDARYSFYLEFGEQYELSAIRDGYFPSVDTLNLLHISRQRELRRNLYLLPLSVGATITLDHVYFHRASEELLEASFPELDRLSVLMKSMPHLENRASWAYRQYRLRGTASATFRTSGGNRFAISHCKGNRSAQTE